MGTFRRAASLLREVRYGFKEEEWGKNIIPDKSLYYFQDLR